MINSSRYAKDTIETNYSENDCLDEFRDLELFYKEYSGESLLNPFISYLDMETFYPIRIVDLGLQLEYVTSKNSLYGRKETAPEYTNLYVILMKHKEIGMA